MEADPLTASGEQLERELQMRRDNVGKVAFRLDRAVAACWWGAISCAGIASALGFVAEIPELKGSIEPWMISCFALVGGGIEIVRRKTSWRAKSNLFYQHRDDLDQLLSRLRYELPKPLTADHVALIARELGERKIAWRDKLRKLNELIDDNQSSGRARRGN